MGVLLTIGGKCSPFGAKSGHFSGHLPALSNPLLREHGPEYGFPCSQAAGLSAFFNPLLERACALGGFWGENMSGPLAYFL